MMDEMYARFENLISDSPTEENIIWLHDFLKNNHGKIVRKKYEKDYTLPTAITFVFRYLCKDDTALRQKIQLLMPDIDLETALYSLASKQAAICENGNSLVLKNPIKGLGYCGTNKSCACFMSRTELSDASLMKLRQKKRAETMKERYGVENPMLSDEFKAKNVENKNIEGMLQKLHDTNMKKYGVGNVFGSETIKKKIKETNIEKYGVENAMQNSDIANKNIESYRSSHEYLHPFVDPSVVEKRKSAYIENKEIINTKIKQTNLKKYGYEHRIVDPVVVEKTQKLLKDNALEISEKTKQTNIERYGTAHYAQKHISADALSILGSKELLEQLLLKKSIVSIADDLGIHPATLYNTLIKHDISIGLSSYETEIAAFLDSHLVQYSKNNRKVISPLELDFYIPEYNVGIEFNGLYWHSDKRVDKNYHLNKWKRCQEAGIRLVSINEDEWVNRSSIIKRKLLNVLGKSDKGPGARKISINKITPSQANDFIDKNHIQGKAGNIIAAYGAFFDNNMIGVIAFNKQRTTGDIELIRFCTDGKTYAGLFSRMFSKIVKEETWDYIISFADLRYSEGNLYEQCGFEKDYVTKPDYRYFKGLKTFHKSTFKKSAIKKNFGIEVSGKTEKQLTEELGYNRIYDCGKIKYSWKRKAP